MKTGDCGVHFQMPPSKPEQMLSAQRASASVIAFVETELEEALEALEMEREYIARPLNGIWATAPYLHNGSVPSLAELLKPPDQRVKKFFVGNREFDPVNVGFSTTQGSFSTEFDTSVDGNSNQGHPKANDLTDDERKQLLEYLKTL